MTEIYDHRLVLGPHSPLSLPLEKLLGSNADRLREVRAEFPKVRLHRDTLTSSLSLPVEELSDPLTHQAYVSRVTTDPKTSCLIYTYGAFFGGRETALAAGHLYPRLEGKIAPFRQMTTGHQVTIFVCIQDFAQFAEAELIRSPHFKHLTETYPDGMDFSWVHFIYRMREAWPEAFIVIIPADTLAANWAGVAALITGHPSTYNFKNIVRFPVSSLAEDGRAPYLKSFRSEPPTSLSEWVSRTTAFFDEYGADVPIIRKVIASPWSEAQAAHSRERFATNLEALKSIDNVLVAQELDWDTL